MSPSIRGNLKKNLIFLFGGYKFLKKISGFTEYENSRIRALINEPAVWLCAHERTMREDFSFQCMKIQCTRISVHIHYTCINIYVYRIRKWRTGQSSILRDEYFAFWKEVNAFPNSTSIYLILSLIIVLSFVFTQRINIATSYD